MRAARDDQNKRIKVNNFRFYNPLLTVRPDAGDRIFSGRQVNTSIAIDSC